MLPTRYSIASKALIAIAVVSLWFGPAALGQVQVSAPDTTATYEESLVIPILIDDISGVLAVEVSLVYDANLLVPNGVTSASTFTDGWNIQTNTESGPGGLDTLKIAAAIDQSSASGAGTLIDAFFTAADLRAPASSLLELVHVLLNDGVPASVADDGSVTLVGNDGSIASSPATLIPRQSIDVTVSDADENRNPAVVEQLDVQVENGNQTETLVVTETTVSSGVFSGSIATVFSPASTSAAASGDNQVQTKAGDQIAFTYADLLDNSGNTVLRSDQTDAVGGADGAIRSTIVTQPGDVVYVRVTDADLNANGGLQESVVISAVSSTGEVEDNIVLNEDGANSDVFFGSISTTSGAIPGTDNDGTLHTQKGDVLTLTYDDVVTALGDQVDRVDDDEVVAPFGDADGNGSVQAFDAAQILLHVLSPFLTGSDSLASNLDLEAFDAVNGKITPFDASLVLQKRVALISLFPVQEDEADNHPQPETDNAVPKVLPDQRLLALRSEVGYVSVWADERAEIISGEVLIEGLEGKVEMAGDLRDFLSASRSTDEGLRVVFAGAAPVEGQGELLRVYSGAGSEEGRLVRGQFNDGAISAVAGEVGGLAALPQTFALHANWPNPFNPQTTIGFDLPRAGAVELKIFDVLGQSVQTLVAEVLPAGGHQVVWDGLDGMGARVGSGVYFYRLQAGEEVQIRRMLLLK